jgi:hypothetical protein
LLTAFLANEAQAMIRHVFIFEPPVSLDQFDVWYFRHHSQECIRYYGPWLRRYETYRSKAVPAEADRYNAYRGRYTELWYDSVEAWREASPYSRSYTQAPWGGLSNQQRPTATVIVPAMPTEDFLGKKEPTPEERPFVRWIFTMRYPDGVSLEEGEKWYLGVHTQEAKRMPGLLRYVSYKAVKDSPIQSPWVRVTELWFKDYEAFHKAAFESGIKYTPPPWAKENQRWLEVVSTFVGYDPEVDFLRDRPWVP